MSICTTDSVIPRWVIIIFASCSLCILIFTSIYSFKLLKQSHSSSSRTSTKIGTNVKKDWQSMNCCGKLKAWIFDVWYRKSVYLPAITHFTDTATDFAAVVEFYLIANVSNPHQCGELNIWYLFAVSIVSMIAYRLISSIVIYKITESIIRIFLQFIDVELFHVLYISHRLGLKNKSSPQRLISSMEAVFESAPQSLIQTIYIIRTGNVSNIIFVSSILSFINLTMTILADDKKFIHAEFQWPCKNNKNDKRVERGCYKFGKFIYLHLFRICDIPSQILLMVFVWHFISGYTLTALIAIDVAVVIICFIKTKSTDALLGVIAIPFSFGGIQFKKLLHLFWYYSVFKVIIINCLVWIWIFGVNKKDIFDQEAIAIIMWIFCSATSIMKWIFMVTLYFKYSVRIYKFRSKERNHVGALLNSEYFEDALELIFYRNFDISCNAKMIYGDDQTAKYSLLAIACELENNQLFESALNVDLDSFKNEGQYMTAIMSAAKKGNKHYIGNIINHPRINLDYLSKKYNNRTALLSIIITSIKEKDDDFLIQLLICIDRLLQNDIDSDAKKIEILNNAYPEPAFKRTALHVACDRKARLSVFRRLYEFYPESYRKEALNKKDKKGHTALDICSTWIESDDVKNYILKQQ